MKRFTVTSDGVSYITVKDTKEEAQFVAERLNDEYYQHKVWNVEEVEFEDEPVQGKVEFDEYGRAWCDEGAFFLYIGKTAVSDDFTKDKKIEGCEVVDYFNGGGCLLARYNRTMGYGETF